MKKNVFFWNKLIIHNFRHEVDHFIIGLLDIKDIRSKLCVIEVPCSSTLVDATHAATGAANYLILSGYLDLALIYKIIK